MTGPAASVLAERARAKINLYLHVTGRRADGYHLLDSLFVFADLHDLVEAAPAPDLTLAVTGPFAAPLCGSVADNHVLQAARALAADAGIAPRAALRLTKRLPVASGLGGGSADAAAALRLLNRLWGLDYGPDRLAAIGAGVGADVPAAVVSRPLRVGGVGERLEPVQGLPPLFVVLVNPGVALATVDVFRRLRSDGRPFSAAYDGSFASDADAFLTSLQGLNNDLEAAAIGLAPVVAEALDALRAIPHCRLARMSGSGATCFGLFTGELEARVAAAALSARHGWWSWAGPLSESDHG